MADRESKPAAPAGDKQGKRPPVKLIGMVAALMALEAVGVAALVTMTGGKPQSARAELQGLKDELEAEVEISLVDERFQNMQTGRVWVWEAQIVLKVKKKNEPHVQETIAARSAEIKEGLGQIMRKAQHTHLKEPELNTISRQLSAYIEKVFGADPEGNPRIERIVIPKWKGIQVEN